MLFVGASQVRWVNFYLDCGATCMNSIKIRPVLAVEIGLTFLSPLKQKKE